MTQTIASKFTGEWVNGIRPSRSCIPRMNDLMEVQGEPVEQTRARAAVIHPTSIVDGYAIREEPYRGARGGVVLTIHVYLPNGDDGVPEALRPGPEDAGDWGGPGDRGIAAIARTLTGERALLAVAESLARHHVHTCADLPRALGLEPGQAMSLDMRAEIGRRLGLVEPTLPEWAEPGKLVARQFEDCRRLYRIMLTDANGVFLEGVRERIPAGVLMVMYEPAVTCSGQAPE
jgi:hypothetical protein